LLFGKEKESFSRAEAVLIFCDTHDDDQLQCASGIAGRIGRPGVERPDVILLHHSVAPELRCKANFPEEHREFTVLAQVLSWGIDAVITEEHCGMELATKVWSRLMQQKSIKACADDAVHQLREDVDSYQYLEDMIDATVWDYLRMRLNTNIPRIQSFPDIEEEPLSGMPISISGLSVGRKLGQGSFGTVFMLVDAATPQVSSGMVVKVMPKSSCTSCYGIKSMARQIKLMTLLSSEEHRHPNIMQFYEVYHMEMHIVFKMEDAGPMDLNKQLILHEKKEFLLTLEVLSSICKQCIDGLHHLHTQMKMVHCDVKPENIIVKYHQARRIFVAKYADFDTARIVTDGVQFRGVRGTFPFMAPEVFVSTWDPFLADIWSLAFVLLEILCHRNVVTRIVLPLPHGSCPRSARDERVEDRKKADIRNSVKVIQEFFDNSANIGRLLRDRLRTECKDSLDSVRPLLQGMTSVRVDQRWTVEKVFAMSPFGPGLDAPSKSTV
jgi:hypothetical protein